MSSTTTKRIHSTVSSYNEKRDTGDSYENTVIGLTADQLKIAQETKFWKMWRMAIVVLFWLLWAGMVAGAVVIVVVKNGDVPETTTTTATKTSVHN
ncbi:unnamed protein product [Haemonchus placei]|uniref:SLC3A2_N domain-containing protein n=1 Tax=Haemonchus placei TaxID=6290 RepID=A0A0N4WXG5_HAEPC|nr:unnamed protein product [Haemonchus placei]